MTVSAAVASAYQAVGFRVGYPTTELLTVLSLVALPLAQYVALRVLNVAWSRDWGFATLAGNAIGNSATNVLFERAYTRFPGTSVVYSIIGAVCLAFFQWLVLRKRTMRSGWWWAASVGTWAIVWGGPKLVQMLPGSSLGARVLISGAAAAIAGPMLAWIAAGAGDDAQRERPGGLLWIEWTGSAAAAAVLIMGRAGVIEPLTKVSLIGV